MSRNDGPWRSGTDPDADPAFRYAAHGGVTLRYAPDDDALTILYGQGQVLHTVDLDERRYLDYSDDGRVLRCAQPRAPIRAVRANSCCP